MEKGMLNRQRTIFLVIAAVAILFALGPIVGNQQAFAYGYSGYDYHHHHYYGGYSGYGGPDYDGYGDYGY